MNNEAELLEVVKAARALNNFAWSAVQCDCRESSEYLLGKVIALRTALANLDARNP